MDCGRRPRLPKICAQNDAPPSENADFDKLKLSLIGSQQCAFHSAIDQSYALPLGPAKGVSNKNFYIW